MALGCLVLVASVLAIIMEGSPQSTYDHAESGQSKRPRLDGGAGMTEEELAALPWGPRAGSLHVGGQPTYNPEEPTDFNELGVERVHAANHPREQQEQSRSKRPPPFQKADDAT